MTSWAAVATHIPYPPWIRGRFGTKNEPLRIGVHVEADQPFRLNLKKVSLVRAGADALSPSVARGPADLGLTRICHLGNLGSEPPYQSHEEIQPPATLSLEFLIALPPHEGFTLKLSAAIYSERAVAPSLKCTTHRRPGDEKVGHKPQDGCRTRSRSRLQRRGSF